MIKNKGFKFCFYVSKAKYALENGGEITVLPPKKEPKLHFYVMVASE